MFPLPEGFYSSERFSLSPEGAQRRESVQMYSLFARFRRPLFVKTAHEGSFEREAFEVFHLFKGFFFCAPFEVASN